MGGRGTFAAGNTVAYTYQIVGKIDGVKILQGMNGVKGLPVEAHSSSAYIQLHPDGKFKMYREFDSDHFLMKEIAYHPEPKLTGHNKPVLHIHEYKRNNFIDRAPRLLTKSEYEKYKKYFKGVE
jgi:hypothetical protein